jgi:DNA sulfur modification protein DndB
MQKIVGIGSGDDLRPVYTAKSKSQDEKTIAASSSEALSLKLTAEEAEGWRVLKQNRRSIRLGRDKSADRQLEDDVWCLLYRMGFKDLNLDRNLSIQAADGAPRRQLDVFAKDDETVFIVECTHAREGGPKSVRSLIDKIISMREDVLKAVQGHYGRSTKLKVKIAIATRDVDWRSVDLEHAKSAGVPVLREEELTYFGKLTDILKTAARYQFLGRYFQGEKVEGLRARVPATRGRVGGVTFYSFLISPHDLLRVAYISHMARGSNEDLQTYQRMVRPNRLTAIGRYIDEGGTFPTNIVVNFKVKGLQFDLGENFGDTQTGFLHLPNRYGSAWVIDGQHRLYAYAYASRAPENDRSLVSVLAYDGLPIRDEIEMFVAINTQQVKVNRNIVDLIVSNLDIDHREAKKRLEALCARSALHLDDYRRSPLQGRILTVAQDKTYHRCLTLTSLADGIEENNLLGSVHKPRGGQDAVLIAGPLGDLGGNSQHTLTRATEVLSGYFRLFAEPLAEHWALGDAKGGYLCTNLGLRALLFMLRRLIAFIERDGLRTNALDPEGLVQRLEPLVEPVVRYFRSADPSDIARFRNRGSSLLSVSQNALQMMAIIGEAIPAFDLPEVRAYLDSQDAEGTKQAKDMIDEINRIVFDDVLTTLKAKFGEIRDAWWMQGVPKNVRIDCDRLYNENQGEHDRWRYLFFVNYADIVTYGDNWDLFKEHYNFYGKGKKADLVRWIGKINKARTVTHHAEKGPLSRDQVEYVRRVHELVKRHIEGGEPVDPRRRYLDDGAQLSEAAA